MNWQPLRRSGAITSGRRLAALAAAAAVLLPGSVATVAAEKDAVIRLADAVPLPRTNPNRQRGDSIGSLISDETPQDSTASVERGARDDSDDPESTAGISASDVPTPPRKPTDAPQAATPKDPAEVLQAVGLRYALAYLDKGDVAKATAAAYALPNPVDVKIIDWLVATSGNPDVPSIHIESVAKRLSDWPGQRLLQIRYEAALKREKHPPADIIKAFGGDKPVTDDGTIMLTRALLETGQRDAAANLIRPHWREDNLSEAVESTILKEFSKLITAADSKARMDRLLYAERSSEALRTAALLDENQRALAKAVTAVIKRQNSAAKALDDLPRAVKNDPLYIYSRIQVLRRADKGKEAAKLLVSAPRDPRVLVDPDAWWVERRLISREMIEAGEAKLAYQIAAGHAAESRALQAEAEFHAGWYALEWLRDPNTAKKHFAAIEAISKTPISLSRAEYWMGRAAAAAGNNDEAAHHFQRAAAYPTAFYGQLAAARLGRKQLGLSTPSTADPAVRDRFNNRELVQVIKRLSATGYGDQADLFARHLADVLTDPSELALLQEMVESDGKHQLSLQIGKIAARRGLPVDTLAFPTAAIPASTKTPRVDKPVVYAIARQESAFNPGAVSHAGARGLLQLMPATAKQTARSIGLPYSQARLTSDPGYNAMLGAAHLGDLFDSFRGSYIMTFAAYNAGSSRVTQWVKRFGDPRDPRVDPVNWIELIPFTETRNYVQRIMENLQVYRARLGSDGLMIDSDLRRGSG